MSITQKHREQKKRETILYLRGLENGSDGGYTQHQARHRTFVLGIPPSSNKNIHKQEQHNRNVIAMSIIYEPDNDELIFEEQSDSISLPDDDENEPQAVLGMVEGVVV